MIDAHEVVDYLKDHFNQSDMEIVLLLSRGTLLMKKCQQKIDAYLSDVIEEELRDRL